MNDGHANLQQNHPGPSSSEFGDDDIPLEAFEAVEQSTYPEEEQAAARTHDRSGRAEISVGVHQNYSDNPRAQLGEQLFSRPLSRNTDGADASHPARTLPDTHSEDDDEFGDGSDDGGLMADLAAQFDTQGSGCDRLPHPQLQKSPGRKDCPATSPRADDDDDDDAYYDDDIVNDDLWNQIGDGSSALQQDGEVSRAGQVRVIL